MPVQYGTMASSLVTSTIPTIVNWFFTPLIKMSDRFIGWCLESLCYNTDIELRYGTDRRTYYLDPDFNYYNIVRNIKKQCLKMKNV